MSSLFGIGRQYSLKRDDRLVYPAAIQGRHTEHVVILDISGHLVLDGNQLHIGLLGVARRKIALGGLHNRRIGQYALALREVSQRKCA